MLQKQMVALQVAAKCRRGAAMVEYALLISLVSAVAVTALTSVGTAIRLKFMALIALL